MDDYMAPVEKELASITVKDLHMSYSHVLDLAGESGSNAAIHGKNLNAKLIYNLYKLTDQGNSVDDHDSICESINSLVEEYSKGWLFHHNYDEDNSNYSGAILLGTQSYNFSAFLAENTNIPNTAISEYLYDLLSTINSYIPNTEDFYLSSKEKESWMNSAITDIYKVFYNYHDLCSAKDVPGSYLRDNIDKLLSTVEWVDSDMRSIAMNAILRYWDIFSRQCDPKIIAKMILADCKSIMDEDQDQVMLSLASKRKLPAEYVRSIKMDTYAKVSTALRSDNDLDPKLTATQIMQAVYCILNTIKPDDESTLVCDILQHSIIGTLYDLKKEYTNSEDPNNKASKFIDDLISVFDNDEDKKSLDELLPMDQRDQFQNRDYDAYLMLCIGLDPDKDLGDDIEELPATEVSYQKSGSSIQKIDVRAGYKLVQDNIVKFNEQAGKMLKALKEMVLGTANMDFVVIEGKKFTFFGLVKKLIGGVALFSFSKIGAVCVLIIRWAAKSKASKQSKRKMLFLLNEEIEIVTEKIDDARAAGDNKAKYALMRSKKELENARDRIKYNLGAEVKSKTVDDLVKRANSQPTDGRDRMGRYVEGHNKKGSRM